MKLRKAIGVVTSLVVLSSAVFAFSPAVAASPKRDPLNTVAQDDRVMVDQAAKDHDVSADRAAELIAGQADFSLLLARLAQEVPQYAGGAIDPTETRDAWIAFTTQPSDAVIESIQKLQFTTELRFDAPMGEKDLLAQLEEEHSWIERQPGVKGATGAADAMTGSLDFTVWTSEAVAAELQTQVDVRRSISGAAVTLAITDAPFPADEATIGGQYLSNGCTSAFTVRNGSGLAGVLSAAHCPNSASGYTFGSEVNSGATDAQWHRVTGVENKIRIGPSGTTRTITSSFVPAAGVTLCVNGSASGTQCSTVYSNTACWPLGGCGFIAMNGGVTTGGDSGGPWYTGNSAVGVHKGTAYIGFGNRSVMTRVGNALSSLGLSLCTASYCGIV